ncbi:MAG TPA: hypothetical protein PK293_13700 [Spirochaetota bacterium]|nr:hypothetical protein [Spirochaetota bacterium]
MFIIKDEISTVKLLTILVITCSFSFLFANLPKHSVVICVVLLAAAIIWVKTDEIDIKVLISVCFFIYPLLPRFWGLRISEGIPAIHAHRVLSFVIIIILIRRKLLISYYRNFFKTGIFTKPILLVLISILLTVFVTENKPGTFFFLVSYIAETILIPVVIFSTYKTREDIEKFLSALIYPAIILAVLGLYENYSEYNIYTIFGIYDESFDISATLIRGGELRVMGPFDHPIAFGAYFALVVPFVIYKYKEQILPLILLLLIFFKVITDTDSRAAQIGFGIIFFVYFLLISKHKFLFFLFLPFTLLSGSFRYRLMTLNPFFSGDVVLQGSANARVEQFNFLKGYIYKNFLLGHGQVETPLMLRWLSGTGLGNYHNTIDSFYVLYIWLYGLCGLLSWILLMMFAIIKPIIIFKNDIFDDNLVLLLLSGLISFCIINLVVALFSFHFLFWIYIGLLTRLMYNYGK